MILLTIPRVPVGVNGPRGMLRAHWATRRRARIVWALEVTTALRSQGLYQPKETQFRDVAIHQVRKRKLDADNLYASCKHVLDSLVSSGLIVDDSPGWIALTVTQETGKVVRTEIRIGERA